MFGSDISARVEAIDTNAPLVWRQRPLGGLGQQERGGEIDVEHAPPLGDGELADRLADHDAGVGHDAVELPEALDRLGDRAFRRRLVADIALDQQDAARQLAERAFEIGTRDIDGADQPAVVEQLPRGRAADAVRRAGDEHDLGLRHSHNAPIGIFR